MTRILVMCEARADFQTTTGLIDRVLRERGPDWLAELMESAPESQRSWQPNGKEHLFFDVHKLEKYCDEHEVRRYPGRFDGKPGAANARMARKAFWLTRRLRQKGEPIAAIVFVVDMDGDGEERRKGIKQARTADDWSDFKIVIGCADLEREAWVLNGFEPQDEAERELLQEAHKEIGFSPVEKAHELTAKDDHSAKSAKRVLNKLTQGSWDRQEQCWLQTPLETLEKNGEGSGLTAFLAEVKDTLIPLCTGAPAQR